MSGWYDLAKTHLAFDDEENDVAFTPHEGGFLAYRISAYSKDKDAPTYCGFGKTNSEAVADYNAGLKAMKASEWCGTKHG